MTDAQNFALAAKIPKTIEGKIALCDKISKEAFDSQDLPMLVAQLALMMADDYRNLASQL